ncbi:hypothetical protein E4T50_11805 [Aureobasidium sp. EXF-12298]|nr:hypothetical protein E4T50_11805 [Aureobasidium sp. EXF-12298]KAI4772231.1 hypothetical protein E4T52_12777 [Aureobasidium sp. EXF-3400]
MFTRSLVRYAFEPVAQRKFDEILWPICRGKKGVGLAISGGVDSMALAILCKRVCRFKIPPITAFIVDHRLRPESTDEAQSVAKYLGQLGIKHKVLTVDWEGVPEPSKIPNLESAARRMRFQALGRACAAAGIGTLLLAHHADDQAETVLARIHAGYLGTGLTGIQPKMPIGECHGLYGVSKSGYLRHLYADLSNLPFFVESGGVEVHRPLLGFTKSELIATCTTNCVKWHEDATNADQTLTPRNAIRKLLQSQLLPAALKSDRLRRLAAHKRSQLTECETTAAAYFRRCPVEIDTNASSVSFQIHPDIEVQLIREKDCQLIAAILMRKFFSLVEEQSRLALKDLSRSVGFVFPAAFGDWQPDSNTVHIGNVTLVKDPSSQEIGTDEQKKYLIFSRPVKAPEQFTQTLLEVTEDNRSTSKEPIWTETKLFHDRWWIKLRYIPANVPVGTTVVIRFLKQGESLKANQRHARAGPKLLPSGKLRHTIPVIVETTKVEHPDGVEGTEERILAFPSVGLRRPDCSKPRLKMGRGNEPEMADDSPWQYTCIYKDIDFHESEHHTRKVGPRKKGTHPFSDVPMF